LPLCYDIIAAHNLTDLARRICLKRFAYRASIGEARDGDSIQVFSFSRITVPVSSNSRNYLRLNVGFIIHQTVGYNRDFPIEIPRVHLPPDLDIIDLSGVARVTRTAQGLLVQARMSAKTVCECVRCLENFQQPLDIDFTELYAFTPNSMTESGLLLPETGQIDLAPLVREEMLLAIPINPLCSEDCKGLCPVCGENLNETTCNHEDETIDPRLAVLKTLLGKGE
jgi:uncharacterized protein